MRTDKLMINADSETIGAFNRARTVKAAAALTLVFSFAVIAVTAPAHASVNHASVEFSASSSEPLVDKHDFINPLKSADAASGTIELEKLFWMCDYAATSGALEAHEIEMCGAVTQQLQRVKFDDDFDKLLVWWRVNKEAQHLAFADAGVIGSCGQGDRQ